MQLSCLRLFSRISDSDLTKGLHEANKVVNKGLHRCPLRFKLLARLPLASSAYPVAENVVGSQSDRIIRSSSEKLGYSHFRNVPLQGISVGATIF